jgi:hypothetical protein
MDLFIESHRLWANERLGPVNNNNHTLFLPIQEQRPGQKAWANLFVWIVNNFAKK